MSSDATKPQRPSGFYWCRHPKHGWIVCWWTCGCWEIPGSNPNLIWTDGSFTEIDERRITREEPIAAKISGTTERTAQNE